MKCWCLSFCLRFSLLWICVFDSSLQLTSNVKWGHPLTSCYTKESKKELWLRLWTVYNWKVLLSKNLLPLFRKPYFLKLLCNFIMEPTAKTKYKNMWTCGACQSQTIITMNQYEISGNYYEFLPHHSFCEKNKGL